jgi:hypothetical protein
MEFDVVLMYENLLYLIIFIKCLQGAGLIPPFKLELNTTERLTKS